MQGTIRFEKTCEIYKPTTSAAYQYANGDGGAVWNGETGLMVFKGEVNMGDLQNPVSSSHSISLHIIPLVWGDLTRGRKRDDGGGGKGL